MKNSNYMEPESRCNIKLSYSIKDNYGSIATSENMRANSCYPFGLKHKGYNSNINGTHHKYMFGGKELQDDVVGGSSLDMYDFGARNYDPALGRWMNIDPLAEEFYDWSPYNFVYNNPLRFVDPTGMGPDDIIFYNNDGQEVHRVKSDMTYEMYLINNDSGGSGNNNITQMIQGANTVETAHMFIDMAPSEFSAATSMTMEFTGDAEATGAKDSQQRDRYTAEGTLTTTVGFENGSNVEIQSVSANSGPHGFGPTPNGGYEGNRIVNTNESGMVRDGVGFKVFLNDNTQLNRTGLRIHPDQTPYVGTAGCIGITESSSVLKTYRSNVRTFLNGYPNTVINVNVNITNNPNYNRPPRGRQNSGE